MRSLYDGIIKKDLPKEQAIAVRVSGLLWTKQFYYYDVLNGFGGPGEAQPIVLTRATQAGNTY
jgi:hypothetical protein